MADESVVIEADGAPLDGVLRLTLSYGATEGVRKASITMVERDRRFVAPPGAKIKITDDGDPVLTGIVRDYSSAAIKDGREITLSIESNTCDLAECSCVHKTGSVKQKKLHEAADELAKGDGDGFAAKIKAEGAFDPIDKVTTVPGETVFELMERYARSQGAYITDDANGDQVLFKGVRGRHSGVLALPGNVIAAPNATLSERNKFSETRVRGQSARKHGKADLRSEGITKNAAVKRYRPQVINHEGEADAQRLRKRAGYDQQRAGAASATATMIAPGWRADDGKHWQPGYIIAVDAWDELRIEGDMAISSVVLRWDKEDKVGKTAILELRDPGSFGEQAKKGASQRSESAWDFVDPEPYLNMDGP
ncbi:hypothetical protein GCM10019059_07760 [Camelimonas fluminis]|uniref:Baseplate hub protein gp44/GpP-like second domain-containing protein n=1 Tax=Camelimonas fluminis TaxID=1576911 RepID=A0ABV7UEB7_9HYPH|nr:hypothetical protein [Camelimonas fluminis]GHE51018.1 hypothetical protein GCM10019059_07760 [Camelimonas fluminis]